MKTNQLLFLTVFTLLIWNAGANTYYVDAKSGNDSSTGTSPETAWQSLEKASELNYNAGDQLLLCEGNTFYGKLDLKGGGTKDSPVIVSSYNTGGGSSSQPVIDAKGYVSAIQILNGKNFIISNLELTADAGQIESCPAAASD